MPPVPRIPILTAPTASGKSALAVAAALAGGSRVEIIAADAFTVYRGLDVGTAKPGPDDRHGVPHHLLDVVEVTEPYDVARFLMDAERVIAEILRRDGVPLVVGGTGFYLRALIRGLPSTPPSDPEVRAAVEVDLATVGLDALLAQIAAVDPAEERRMERNPRRVVRALELLRSTGRLPGHFPLHPPAFDYEVVAFARPVEETTDRIGQRTRAMLRGGWPEEAAWLAARVDPEGLPQPTVWQALGYREALAVQRGTRRLEEAEANITLATRQYVKRQATFLRTQLGAALETPEDAARQLHSVLV